LGSQGLIYSGNLLASERSINRYGSELAQESEVQIL